MTRYLISFGIQVGHYFTEVASAVAVANSAQELVNALPHLPMSPLRSRANAVLIRPENDMEETSVRHVYQPWNRSDLPLAA